jgi:hypothetical protein
MSKLNNNPLRRFPIKQSGINVTSRYFYEGGPLLGLSKYCAFCETEPIKYISSYSRILSCCHKCMKLVGKYLTLHEHTVYIKQVSMSCSLEENSEDIMKYSVSCNSQCTSLVSSSSKCLSKGEKEFIECEVLGRLEDITYWPVIKDGKNIGLSTVDLLKKFIEELEKPCVLCSSISTCFVARRHFKEDTLNFSPIFPLCNNCFKQYSLKHRAYPPHRKMCPDIKKCYLSKTGESVCGYNWSKISECIESGRDGHQMFCENCEHFEKIKENYENEITEK